jgi:primosomal replication protein N
MATGVNRLSLYASLMARDTPRHSPAGVPVQGFTLSHTAAVPHHGAQRQVAFELKGMAFEALAQTVAALPLGAFGQWQGFLAGSYRGKQLVLQLQRFTPLIEGTNHGTTEEEP